MADRDAHTPRMPEAGRTALLDAAASPVEAPVHSAGPRPPRHRADPPRSLSRDAWRDLRRRPIFVISAVVIVILVLIAAFPGLFAAKSPTFCDLNLSRQGPGAGAWFGYDVQGCDVYARTIHGARASILVGFLATIGIVVIGGLVGMTAGFYAGWVDSVLSRILEVFFGIPLLLGGILVLASFPSGAGTPTWLTIGKVVLALSVLGWTTLARIMRSTVIQVKHADYVQAARALGASGPRLIRRHVLPNAAAPVIVYATIVLGVLVAVEATLSYLGIGLQPPVVSWGVDISNATTYMRQSPHMLLFPSAFLSVTVLAFIMLGDAARDALDPKLR
jgi:oligopeptide transport system permease protein